MEKSAGIILFREKNHHREYLILKHNTVDKYWGLAKGHLENDETHEQAALREAEEETGFKEIKLIPNYKEKTNYYFKQDGKVIYKEVTWFLGKAEDNHNGKISHEHEELKWLPYQATIKQLNFKKDQQLIEKAEQLLSK